jgi:hypothetical protein
VREPASEQALESEPAESPVAIEEPAEPEITEPEATEESLSAAGTETSAQVASRPLKQTLMLQGPDQMRLGVRIRLTNKRTRKNEIKIEQEDW